MLLICYCNNNNNNLIPLLSSYFIQTLWKGQFCTVTICNKEYDDIYLLQFVLSKTVLTTVYLVLRSVSSLRTTAKMTPYLELPFFFSHFSRRKHSELFPPRQFRPVVNRLWTERISAGWKHSRIWFWSKLYTQNLIFKLQRRAFQLDD